MKSTIKYSFIHLFFNLYIFSEYDFQNKINSTKKKSRELSVKNDVFLKLWFLISIKFHLNICNYFWLDFIVPRLIRRNTSFETQCFGFNFNFWARALNIKQSFDFIRPRHGVCKNKGSYEVGSLLINAWTNLSIVKSLYSDSWVLFVQKRRNILKNLFSYWSHIF